MRIGLSGAKNKNETRFNPMPQNGTASHYSWHLPWPQGGKHTKAWPCELNGASPPPAPPVVCFLGDANVFQKSSTRAVLPARAHTPQTAGRARVGRGSAHLGEKRAHTKASQNNKHNRRVHRRPRPGGRRAGGRIVAPPPGKSCGKAAASQKSGGQSRLKTCAGQR